MGIVHTQTAYILHKRDYRETSSIIELLTREYGRIAILARGARGSKSRIAGRLMPFKPLLVSWQGRGELPYLKSVEPAELKPPVLAGKSLYSAMYINELLVYFLQRQDVHEGLFEAYHLCLYALASDNTELALRNFELNLLDQMGFGLNLESMADIYQPGGRDGGHDGATKTASGGVGNGLADDSYYRFIPETGLVPDAAGTDNYGSGGQTGARLSGRCLNLMARGGVEALVDYPELMRELKVLMRYVIDHQLAGRKLRSRDLFISAGSVERR